VITITLAPEPASFDTAVRQRGLSAIDEMVGRKPRLSRPGRRRKKIAEREADIPPVEFPPYWREALDDLLSSYGRLCAFLALYLEHATGNPSVDHMLPKSKQWDRVYEWTNFRLCAATINARKTDMTGIIDPVECGPGWLALELVGFQVTLGQSLPGHIAAEIQSTLAIVNAPDCCKARGEYVTCYEHGDITFDYLNRRAPFVAQELRRQGRLRPED